MNWKYLVVFGAVVIALGSLYKDKNSLVEQLQSTRAVYENRINEIESARSEERKKNNEALSQLKKELNEVQTQYDKAMVELKDKQKKEIEDLVKNYGDDPSELAKKLSEVTGFKIILPEQP